MTGDNDTHWSLDKRVPVTLIITMILQTFAAIWWASALNERVTYVERVILQKADERDKVIRLEEKLLGVERQLSQMQGVAERIERKLDQIIKR